MISFGFHILLRDLQAAEKYKRYHQNVWPEVGGPGGALEKIGIKKMIIFFVNPLKLFMYIETIDSFNPEEDFDRAVKMDPRVEEWCNIMNNELLQRLNPDEGSLVWQPMEKIYHYALE